MSAVGDKSPRQEQRETNAVKQAEHYRSVGLDGAVSTGMASMMSAAVMVLVAGLAAPHAAHAEAKAQPKAEKAQKQADAGRAGPGAKAGKPGQAGKPGARGGKPPGAGRPGGRPSGRPPMFVGVDPVIKGPLTQTEPAIGRFVATQQGIVAARAAGAVVEINIAVGQHVKKGDVLARLDTSSAEAKLAYETAELKLAEQELKRFESLRSSQSAAFARSRYDAAVHKLARAKANVRIAQLAIRDAVVRAPYAGIVMRKATELGAYVSVGAAVAELVNDANVEIEADVPADRMRGLRPGTVITFAFREGGKRHKARVRAILPMQNSLTRTSAIRFTPLNPAKLMGMAINQAVTINVPLGATRIVVSVHKDAIINRGEQRLVYVVKGGKALPRPVQLGDAIGSRFVVKSGLAPGDIVVVRGNERLRPGQAVRHRPIGASSRSEGSRSARPQDRRPDVAKRPAPDRRPVK